MMHFKPELSGKIQPKTTTTANTQADYRGLAVDQLQSYASRKRELTERIDAITAQISALQEERNGLEVNRRLLVRAELSARRNAR